MALPGVAQRLTGPKLNHYGDLVDRLLRDPDSVMDAAEAMHAVKILALRLKTAERRLDEIREDNRLLLGLYRRALLKDSPRRPSEDRVAVSAQRLRLYEAAGGTCAWCGRFMLLGDVAIDHITPKKRLGLNCKNNLQALHEACNAEKRTRSMADAPHARYRSRRGCSALYPCDACYARVVERREARRRERSKRLSGPI